MSMVITEIIDTIGILTMNNVRKVNALSAEFVDEIVQALEEFREKKILVVIIRGPEGGTVWSAGHDVNELPRKQRDPLGYFDSLEKLLRAVEEYPGPVIAMVHGSAWGGACDFIMTCDIIIGDETSAFVMTPAKLGVPYNTTGILHFMNRLSINIAKEMFFTASPVPAERALQLGILNYLVPSGTLYDFTIDIARTITTRAPLSIQVIKEQFRILSKAHPISPDAFERIQGLRRKVYDSRDYEEGIRSFLEKRPPRFRGE